jgi:methylthioribose-1-phosphate isomerase
MNVDGQASRSIWEDPEDPRAVCIIDQRLLPYRFAVRRLRTWRETRDAIADMAVRGAPLIGATAAYGMMLAAAAGDDLAEAVRGLAAARPTAVNLAWALARQQAALRANPEADPEILLRGEARRIAEEDVAVNAAIGRHGLPLLQALHRAHPDRPVQVLTHCNAGWLATVDWGTATAPLYLAHNQGIPLHVWVDETRPRNQGARLTAWELGHHGIPHTVIADNAGGHLMQHGRVDLLLTGTDRTTRTGDVCNKIGTYLKALAAHDNHVPFYVALPSSTIDWSLTNGIAEIPIEERDPSEVTHISGRDDNGHTRTIRIPPDQTPAANFAFDVTPARLVTGFITECGICQASESGLQALFPEAAGAATRPTRHQPPA